LDLSPEVETWCNDQGFGAIESHVPVGGGCIHQGTRLLTESGQSFFLKRNSSVPPDLFEREAEGLTALRATETIHVPEPFLIGESFLLMEDLKPASRRPGFWSDFGRRLGTLHDNTEARYGFEHDNYLGSTPQLNPWTVDGYEFFGEHRLLYQARLAHERSLLNGNSVAKTERLCNNLRKLVPEQPPSLLHGDLWSGNTLADDQGMPAIIDPAVHYGWAESELGMTTLFGAFPESFYISYSEVRPLEAGWRERLPIYNLYHLLNHLNLFGRSYLAQVESILARFA
jgi:fructosamine-3-kinase